MTGVALESGDVAVLRTYPAGGALRETRVWWVREPGGFLLESATADRPWYLDLLADPRAEFEADGQRQFLVASPLPNPQGHLMIRHSFRRKYGWADAWVGLIQETGGSIAVRLEPVVR